MDEKVCQSCGMPLGDPAFYGTNADESRNEDYCIYCFAGGEFNEEPTLEEMTEQCVEMYAANTGADEDAIREARIKIAEFLPTLKRWRQS